MTDYTLLFAEMVTAIQEITNTSANMTGAEVLAVLAGVDGAGSGLDADLLDGVKGKFIYETAIDFDDVVSMFATVRSTINSPNSTSPWWYVINLHHRTDTDTHRAQLAISLHSDTIFMRRKDASSWFPWREIMTSVSPVRANFIDGASLPVTGENGEIVAWYNGSTWRLAVWFDNINNWKTVTLS